VRAHARGLTCSISPNSRWISCAEEALQGDFDCGETLRIGAPELLFDPGEGGGLEALDMLAAQKARRGEHCRAMAWRWLPGSTSAPGFAIGAGGKSAASISGGASRQNRRADLAQRRYVVGEVESWPAYPRPAPTYRWRKSTKGGMKTPRSLQPARGAPPSTELDTLRAKSFFEA